MTPCPLCRRPAVSLTPRALSRFDRWLCCVREVCETCVAWVDRQEALRRALYPVPPAPPLTSRGAVERARREREEKAS